MIWYVPSNTTHDINVHQELLRAYEIEFCLMSLGSDVKRQLSLLLSSVNKTWYGRRLVTIDTRLHHTLRYFPTAVLMRTFTFLWQEAKNNYATCKLAYIYKYSECNEITL